jgi:hypothetical protein
VVVGTALDKIIMRVRVSTYIELRRRNDGKQTANQSAARLKTERSTIQNWNGPHFVAHRDARAVSSTASIDDDNEKTVSTTTAKLRVDIQMYW